MKTKIETAPTTEPVTLAEAKAQSGVTISDDDTLIGIYLSSAVSQCEQYLQRKLITQTWKVYLDSWSHTITLPFGDLQSVTHVKYTDDDGEQSTVDSSVYTVDTVSVPGRVVLKDGESWPSDVLFAVNPIEIQFVTGYGATAASVPVEVKHGIMFAVAHAYENRETHLLNEFGVSSVVQIPQTSFSRWAPYRVWRWVL